MNVLSNYQPIVILGRVLRYALLFLAVMAGYCGYKACILSSEYRALSQVSVMRGIAIDYLLTSVEMSTLNCVPSDFAVARNEIVLLACGNELKTVRRDAAAIGTAIVKTGGDMPQGFAFDSRDTLLTVHEGFFGALAEDGNFHDAVPLPLGNFRLGPALEPGSVFLYGGTSEEDQYVYRFRDDGTYDVLLKADEPIESVADGRPRAEMTSISRHQYESCASTVRNSAPCSK